MFNQIKSQHRGHLLIKRPIFGVMKKLVTIILSVLIIILGYDAISQQLEYDIIWLGKIGKLNINKTNKDKYSFIETNSEVKVLFYKLNWKTSTTVMDGKLQTSDYSQLLNNKKRKFTEIDYVTDSMWQIVNDIGQNEFIYIKHQFNVSDLYFKEPVNEKYIFSERFGRPFELVNKGKGQYRLLLPEKNYCDYYYIEGICTSVKAKNGSRTIKFVLSDKG